MVSRLARAASGPEPQLAPGASNLAPGALKGFQHVDRFQLPGRFIVYVLHRSISLSAVLAITWNHRGAIERSE